MSDKVKISDAIDTIDSNIAASLKAVKIAYDKANEANEIANLARSSASTALSTANTANTNANNALNKVNSQLAKPTSTTWRGIPGASNGFPIPSGGTWACYYGAELMNGSSRGGGTTIIAGGSTWRPNGGWEAIHSFTPPYCLAWRIS